MSLLGVTRGPWHDENADATAIRGLDGKGPLVSGPLGPLVSPRVELGEEVAAYLHSLWGADDLGSFRCPLPGHRGRARLVECDGDLRLGCCSTRWRSLGEVWAAIAYGQDAMWTNIELATWTRRLAHEAGTFEPLCITLPELPGEAPEHAHVVRLGFAELVGLRWKDYPPREVPYAVRFCAPWCGLTRREAFTGLQIVRSAGVIVQVNPGARLPLYMPGGIGAQP